MQAWAWLIVAILGALMGFLSNLVMRPMPMILSIGLGVLGALLGALLWSIAPNDALGTWSFYLSGAILAICCLFGGSLAFNLTSTEKRI